MKFLRKPDFLRWGLASFLALAAGISLTSTVVAKPSTPAEPPELEIARDRIDWLPAPAAKPIVPGLIDPSPSTSRVIYEEDDRIPMTNRDYPWSAVGRLVVETADGETGLCTGTLVATDIVLTNAHCVVTPETHQLHKRIAFQPNLINGYLAREEDIAWGKNVVFGTDFSDGADADPDDWALIKLDRSLGERYGTLRWQALPAKVLLGKAEKLFLVGYSADFPPENPGKTAGVHVGCSIREDAEDFWVHDCDTTGGASGGPILAEIDDEFYVVALHAIGVTDEDKVPLHNLAVKIDRIEAWIKAQQ